MKSFRKYMGRRDQRTAKEIWCKQINDLLSTDKRLRFTDPFIQNEDWIININRYEGISSIPPEYLKSRDSVPIFLMNQISSRISADLNFEKFPYLYFPIRRFYERQILIHLCIYPFIASGKTPFKKESIRENVLKLKFSNYDLRRTWRDAILPFIRKRKNDHFVNKFFPGRENELSEAFSNYINLDRAPMNSLKKNKMPLLSGMPFKIRLDGEKDVIMKRLTQLYEFLRSESK